jgi:DNA-binding CsgD family transcriptional regulator
VRLYNSALRMDAGAAQPWPEADRADVHARLGRAAAWAGDVSGALAAAEAGAAAARRAERPDLLAEAVLVLEAVPDPSVNAVTRALCEEALTAATDPAVRARLLALRSHLAFYAGEQDRLAELSAQALAAARQSGDDTALAASLRARQEARPGPAGKAERLAMAAEMLAVAVRNGSPRTAMWGLLWRIEALLEDGRISAAAEELGALAATVDRVGGPVSAWHLDRVSACVAQASGRYAEAAAIGRRGFARMRPVEPMPATGAFFALQCALARHVTMSAEAEELARSNFAGLPRFRTMARLHRAYLQQRLGLTDLAAASYQEAGPPEAWEIPAFFYLPGQVLAVLVTIELERPDHLTVVLERLQDYRGEHVSANGVAYAGPVELALGMGAVALGRWTDAVVDLSRAVQLCDGVGAVGFGAEARLQLAEALLGRGDPPDRERACTVAAEADRVARALGMSVVAERTGALLARLDAGRPTPGGLSSREAEVAALVASGLTNRQIAERLVISERTAQNHVQHILTKLCFTTRSQIAAWHVGTPRRDEQ